RRRRARRDAHEPGENEGPESAPAPRHGGVWIVAGRPGARFVFRAAAGPVSTGRGAQVHMLRHAHGPRPSAVTLLALRPLWVVAGATRLEAQTRAYVVHSAAGVVSAIDTATGAVTGTIAVGTHPNKVAITRDGTRA